MLLGLINWMEMPRHPLLGPNLRFLTAVGLWPPHSPLAATVFFRTIHAATLVFVVTQFMGLRDLLPDLDLVVDNLSLSTVSLMAVVKLVSYLARRDLWTELISAIGYLECSQLGTNRPEIAAYLATYRRRSRIITYGFMFICICTISMVNAGPLVLYVKSSEYREALRNGSIPYPRIFKSWFPMDVSCPPAYGIAVAIEAPIGFFGATVLGVWDTLIVAVMIFFAGQFRLLQSECALVFGLERSPVSEEEARRRIIACHNHHLFLLKYGRKFNSLISPVMFIYFIVCSMMLCAILIQLTAGVDAVRLLWTLEYLGACFTQLFLYYWHSNEVYIQSGETEGGAWNSLWYTAAGSGAGAKRASRELLLLGVGLRQKVIFTAGPFNDMTIATFLAILKVSYSYFTLLRSTEQ